MKPNAKIQFGGALNELSHLRASLHVDSTNIGRFCRRIKELKTIRPAVIKWGQQILTTLADTKKPVFAQVYIKRIDEQIQLTKLLKEDSLTDFRELRKELHKKIKENSQHVKYSTRDIIKLLKTRLTVGEYAPSSLKLDGDYLYFTLLHAKFDNLDVPEVRIRYNIRTKSLRCTGVSQDVNDKTPPFEFENTPEINTVDDWFHHLEKIFKRIFLGGSGLTRLFATGTYPATLKYLGTLEVSHMSIPFKSQDTPETKDHLMIVNAYMRPEWYIEARKLVGQVGLKFSISIFSSDGTRRIQANLPVPMAEAVLQKIVALNNPDSAGDNWARIKHMHHIIQQLPVTTMAPASDEVVINEVAEILGVSLPTP